jgi:hypothetical protein
MDEVLTRARCANCGQMLAFDDWKRGVDRCMGCRARRGAATVDGGIVRRNRGQRPPAYATDYREHQRLLDEVPDELIDELVAALERESSSRPGLRTSRAPGGSVIPPALREIVDEIGIGRDPRELPWAAWGFAIGFGANVVLAKYVQMSTGASFSSFVMPLLIGGLVAGGACAGIGWGLAKLRERA